MTVESALVGIIVACCAVFSAWRLMSIRLRLKTLDAPFRSSGHRGSLRRKTLAKMSGGLAGGGALRSVSERSQRERSTLESKTCRTSPLITRSW